MKLKRRNTFNIKPFIFDNSKKIAKKNPCSWANSLTMRSSKKKKKDEKEENESEQGQKGSHGKTFDIHQEFRTLD